MGLFSSIGGSISKAVGGALTDTVRQVANQAIGSVVSQMPPVVGQVVGGLLSGQSLGQVVRGVASQLLGNALNSIPGALGDFFRQAVGGNIGQQGFTFGGLPGSTTQILPASTAIRDNSNADVEITIDSFF